MSPVKSLRRLWHGFAFPATQTKHDSYLNWIVFCYGIKPVQGGYLISFKQCFQSPMFIAAFVTH